VNSVSASGGRDDMLTHTRLTNQVSRSLKMRRPNTSILSKVRDDVNWQCAQCADVICGGGEVVEVYTTRGPVL